MQCWLDGRRRWVVWDYEALVFRMSVVVCFDCYSGDVYVQMEMVGISGNMRAKPQGMGQCM